MKATAIPVLFALTLPGIAQAQSPPTQPSPNIRAASFRWMACLADAATALASQPEPVATIVKGAYGNCAVQESTLRTLAESEGGRVYANAMVDTIAKRMENVITGRVLNARAASHKQP